jgi:hypothetical protein
MLVKFACDHIADRGEVDTVFSEGALFVAFASGVALSVGSYTCT